MGKAINEKTLELNVSAEVLCFLRRTHDPTAYLRGFTQAEEKGCGADLVARFRKGPQCRGSIVMQFKAPLDRSRHPYSYKFELSASWLKGPVRRCGTSSQCTVHGRTSTLLCRRYFRALTSPE